MKSSVILLLILLGYLILYNFFYKQIETRFSISKIKIDYSSLPISLVKLYILSLISIVFYLYLIKFKWELLLFRPFVFDLKNNTNLGLIGYGVLLIVKVIPYFVMMYYWIVNKIFNKHQCLFILFTLIICFPTSLSRSILALLFIPVVLLFSSWPKKGLNYVLLFIFGLIVVFPLLNSFRHWNEGDFSFDYQLFNSGHFDAFQNFSLLVNEDIITNGKQLLGSLLFFVQESVWSDRPVPTGHLLGEKIGYTYLNVAMPYFGEGYANFGYLGVLLFTIFIALVNSVFDFRHFKMKTNIFEYMIFLSLLGAEFYLLRGSLWSFVKLFIGVLISLLVIWFVICFRHKKNINL
ncbi:O-antigen polymerase [Flavicella sediminum]|uniref:O-antigen polymerase n=1 Tax=Flavicella sediminum TaxID=2585141 RepID=UPI001121CB9D|nr:O-antigen polymerase [Flavicella sediminum]